jgi:hypothetical protein
VLYEEDKKDRKDRKGKIGKVRKGLNDGTERNRELAINQKHLSIFSNVSASLVKSRGRLGMGSSSAVFFIEIVCV